MSKLEDLFGKGNEDPFGFGKRKEKDSPNLYSIKIEISSLFGGEEEYKDKEESKKTPTKLDIGSIIINTKEEKLIRSTGLLSKIIKEDLYYKIEKEVSKEKNYTEIFEEKINPKILENYANNIIKKYNLPSFTKNFASVKASPVGLNLTLKDDVSITADNIGEFALPIVEYIHQTQPDYVIASDRGARFLGLAVYNLYRRLYGRFPTADGTLRFRRFSKSNGQRDTERHLKPLVDEMLASKSKPVVLVLDDWVVSGRTKRLAQETFDRLSKGRIKTRFGVLVGVGADISGHNSHTSGFARVTDWRDESNIIGVRYGNDDYSSSGIRGRPVRSEQARDYRRRMYEGIEKLAEKLLSQRSEKTA